MNENLEHNYGVFQKYRQFINRKYNPEQRSNHIFSLTHEQHIKCYHDFVENQVENKNLSSSRFHLHISPFTTHYFKLNEIPKTRSDFRNIADLRSIETAIFSGIEKQDLFQKSIKQNFQTRYLNGLDVSTMVRIFQNYEKRNINADRIYQVQHISYENNNNFHLSCHNVSTNDVKLLYANPTGPHITTEMNLEICYYDIKSKLIFCRIGNYYMVKEIYDYPFIIV